MLAGRAREATAAGDDTRHRLQELQSEISRLVDAVAGPCLSTAIAQRLRHFDLRIPSRSAYYLAYPEASAGDESIKVFREWIPNGVKAEAGQRLSKVAASMSGEA
jgi:hypothetical protein